MTEQPHIDHPKEGSQHHVEQYILDVFHTEATQDRLKAQMEQVVRTELGRMSDLLREAIRDWVGREKSKHATTPPPPPQETALLEEKLETYAATNKKLVEENTKLQRETRLKDIENKMILAGLKKALPKGPA